MALLRGDGIVQDSFTFIYVVVPETEGLPFNDALVFEQHQYEALTPEQVEALKEQRFAEWISLSQSAQVLVVSKTEGVESYYNKNVIGSVSGATANIHAVNQCENYTLFTLGEEVTGVFEIGEEVLLVDPEVEVTAPTLIEIFGAN